MSHYPAKAFHIQLLRHASGKPKGAALVTLDSPMEVQNALLWNGSEFQGQLITIQEHERPNGKGRGNDGVGKDAACQETKIVQVLDVLDDEIQVLTTVLQKLAN